MGRIVLAAVVSSVLAAVLVTLLLHLFTGEANSGIVAGVTGAVAASSAVVAASRKPEDDEGDSFEGVFESDAPARGGD